MAHNEPSDGPSSLENRSTPTTGRPWPWPQFHREDDPSTGIDQKTYHNLVLYTRYASAAYQPMCPRPMGNTLVGQVCTLFPRIHAMNVLPSVSVYKRCYNNSRFRSERRQTQGDRCRFQRQ
ncbi:hypothetical protein F5J12DRAFT_800046 [Pisolithus orientalis]|uniref:uncharacterized protein n=1 Tax=Pisolithus orientalis TaxID=936130 RepID=UPI002224825C|nr:uncharacterized protein F5J12DRAFT_800046 [Pisolithus orientalis]KAI6033274.1 hypothetical protein F5J12DRAFT_800046 [Pisolithus orientalis]